MVCSLRSRYLIRLQLNLTLDDLQTSHELMDFYPLPAATRVPFLLSALAVALVLFHIILIRLWPLGKTAWKRVDYVWLSMAFIGVVGGAR